MWTKPSQPNAAAALSGNVGVAAPLIAAFELAAVVTLLTSDSAARLRFLDWGILALVMSAISMVLAIQYGFWAVSYWSTPGDLLSWEPRAGTDAEALTRTRRLQAVRIARFEALRVRAERLFQLGLVTFLVGIGLLLWPDSGASAARQLAAWAVVAVLVVESLWIVSWRWHDWFVRRFGAPGGRPPSVLSRLDNVVLAAARPLWPPLARPNYPMLRRVDHEDVLGLHDTPERYVDALADAAVGASRVVEHHLGSVRWTAESSVTVGQHVYATFTMVHKPWALIGDGTTAVVIHPFGAMEGPEAEVDAQLAFLTSFLPSRDKAQVDAIRDHLNQTSRKVAPPNS